MKIIDWKKPQTGRILGTSWRKTYKVLWANGKTGRVTVEMQEQRYSYKLRYEVLDKGP